MLVVVLIAEFAFGLSAASSTFVLIATGILAATVLVLLEFLQRDPKDEALAAAVEQVYPEFEERLLTSVELCQTRTSSAPAALVAALLQQTSEKSANVDVTRIVGLQRERRFIYAAGASLILAMFVTFLLHPLRDFGEPTTMRPAPPVAAPINIVETTVTVSPPAYVLATLHPVRVIKDGGNVDALEFSRVRIEVRFDRPAAQGAVIVRRAKESHALVLQMAEDSQSGFIDLPWLPEGDHPLSIRLEDQVTADLPRLRIARDDPPVLSKLEVPRTEIVDPSNIGETKLREVSPSDILTFNFTAEDKVGLDRVELELRINDLATQSEVLAKADGQLNVSQEFTFALKDRVKDGDVLLYRLKAVDNRRIPRGSFTDVTGAPAPENDLEPQATYAPTENKWYAVRIKSGVKSLEEQDILSERDETKNRLEALRKKLLAERGELNKLRPRVRTQPELWPELKKELLGLRKQNDGARDDSLLLAQSLGREMSLRALAAQLFELAEDELAKSGAAFDRASESPSSEKDKELAQADQQLARGIRRLDLLLKLNQELAQYRLDRAKLAELGRRQEELARQAAEADAKKLSAEQQRLAQEFKRLLEQSRLFQKSMDALRQMEANRLSKEAHQLARQQRELANQTADNLRRQLMDKLAPLVEKQKQLAAQAGKLGDETGRTLDSNGMPRFENAEAMKAAESLQQGRVAEAMSQQKATSNNLNRLGKDLEAAINLSRSPREAALQLARRQEEYRKKLERLGQDFARLPPEKLRQAMQELTKAQSALAQAIKKLGVPPDAQALRKSAEQRASQAGEQIERDALSAFEKMAQARDALQQLAQKLPSMPEAPPKDSEADKTQRKQAEAARQLAKDQEAIRKAVEQAVKDAQGSPSVAQDQEKQKQLMAEAKQLAEELMKLSQAAGASDDGKQKAGEASQSAQQAQESMKQGQSESKQGNAEQGSQMAQQAAQELDQAGVDAALAGQMFVQKKTDDAAGQTATELQQSQQAMQQAQQDLKQGQMSSAAKAMQQAGQAMRRAAQQAAAQASPQGINSYVDQKMGKEGELIAGPDGNRPKELTDSSRAWGDLPGELRTRILQDLRVRHGEDYGAIIQHYFREIADVPGKKK